MQTQTIRSNPPKTSAHHQNPPHRASSDMGGSPNSNRKLRRGAEPTKPDPCREVPIHLLYLIQQRRVPAPTHIRSKGGRDLLRQPNSRGVFSHIVHSERHPKKSHYCGTSKWTIQQYVKPKIKYFELSYPPLTPQKPQMIQKVPETQTSNLASRTHYTKQKRPHDMK
jgi:hypothetical protein